MNAGSGSGMQDLPETSLAPLGAVRLPMRVRPSSRIAALLASVVVGFLAVIWFVLLLAIPKANMPSLARSAVWALVASLLVATLWGALMTIREAFRRPHLSVDMDSVTLHNPIVLRRGLVLPLDSILAVAVDTPDDPGFWDPYDLPVEIQHERGVISWTAGREENQAVTYELTRFLVPLVDRDDELSPNVALVLKNRLEFSKLKRSTFSTGGVRKTLVGTKSTQGFLVAVKDPLLAQEAFKRAGVVRKLTSADRHLLEPQREDFRRLRRVQHVAAFGWAYLTLLIAERIWKALS
jgi:hypothetical protein